LTGKYNTPQKNDQRTRLNVEKRKPSDADLRVAETVVKIAKEIGKTPSQAALNWIIQQSPNMFPIIGVRSVAQIKDNLGYDSFCLTKEQIKELDDVSRISLGFPGDFFKSELIQNFAFGGTLKKIQYNQ